MVYLSSSDEEENGMGEKDKVPEKNPTNNDKLTEQAEIPMTSQESTEQAKTPLTNGESCDAKVALRVPIRKKLNL